MAGSLIPAATAITFANLISRTAVAPLLAYLCVALLGQALATVREPLSYRAQMRIDGDHRADVAGLTGTSPTIGALERPDVQALIRRARADPESFMDGTPGPGALAQLDILGRAIALTASGAVLLVYSPWPLILLASAAAGSAWLIQQEGRDWRRVWRHVPGPARRAEVWSDALISPAEGKDVRVFGLGDYAADRIEEHMRAAFDPVREAGRRVLARQWWQLPLIGIPWPPSSWPWSSTTSPSVSRPPSSPPPWPSSRSTPISPT
ncbi:hypothetical protein [Dactylosporangium sp. NPDC051541]|uniref:hypothetical protein n=1 Tax=Dactylosporangium sp. NPDC051541 TaxID=3363977 RepID=UPI0037880A30